MIRLLVRLVLVLVLIAALLIGMTCCAARVVFGSCAEIGVQQTVRNLALQTAGDQLPEKLTALLEKKH